MSDVSALIDAARTGGAGATDRLFELLYGELRSLARRQLNRHGGRQQLNTTMLVHESYLKLLSSGEIKPEDRRHFLAYASAAMRSIIIDFARRQLADKRGSGNAAISLNTDLGNELTASNEELLHLHDALERLASMDSTLAKIVEMRFFGGLTEPETAEALDLSLRTVQRGWEKARMYLANELLPL